MVRRLEQGIYLGNEESDESVLLPNRYITKDMQLGDMIDVFVYNDSEDRIVATTLTPKITLNKFENLRVTSVTNYGAFMDWGLAKDIFVPFREQVKKMEEGDTYIVCLYLDEETNRLAASSKINRFLKNETINVKEKDEVDLLIADITDIGINVIINDQYKGILYQNEIFQPLDYGERVKGFIKKIREDKKIDVSLQKSGYANVEPNEKKILEKLKQSSGFLNLSDKSDPDDITEILEMSKKTFKKAIGSLFKQRLIKIEEKGIYLVKKN